MKHKIHSHVTLVTDGGARGNPGPSAIGYIILGEDGKWLDHGAKYIGIKTNNQAEYRALIKGLMRCRRYTDGDVKCISDSELMIKQLNHEYKIKNPVLKKLAEKIKKIITDFDQVIFSHARRTHELIQCADQLLNSKLDSLD